MEYPPISLPPEQSFDGAGVYMIHYHGTFEAYEGMSDEEPIYVGKAENPGKRQGRQASKSLSPTLYRRLVDHAESIRRAENLDLRDFRCRWLVLDPVWIGLTEQVLIAKYRPIWNAVVDGFGNHDPGSRKTESEAVVMGYAASWPPMGDTPSRRCIRCNHDLWQNRIAQAGKRSRCLTSLRKNYSEKEEKRNKDMWTLSDVDLAWRGEIAEKSPAVYSIINAARYGA